jgi:hypothetical protein
MVVVLLITGPKGFRQIVRFFCLDIEAKKTAELTGISRQSINKIYAAIRQRIVDICSVPIQTNISFEIPANSYYRITVYLWLEGQDVDCKNAISGSHMNIQLAFTKALDEAAAQ